MSNEYYNKFPYESAGVSCVQGGLEACRPVKDESITFRLEPDNDKWAVAGVSGSLTVGHVPLGVSSLIAEQMQNGADLTTNFGKVSKSFLFRHLLRFYLQINFDTLSIVLN